MKKLKKQRLIDNIVGKFLCFLNSFSKDRELKKDKKVLVYRLSALGDSILLLPMLKRLKDKKKDSKIIVACSEKNKSIFEGQDFIDEIIDIPNNTLNPFKILKSIKNIKRENPDIAIDTTQSLNFSAYLSKKYSGYSIGFKNRVTKSRNKNYDSLIRFKKNKHTVLNYFDLLKPLSIEKPENMDLVKPEISKDVEKRIDRLIKEKAGNKKKIVGVHAQTIMKHKMWPLNRWAEIIKYLVNKNYEVILIGSDKETKLSNRLTSHMDKKHIKNITNLVGKTSIKETIALMPHFKFFLSNDGGPMHIAASFNLPVIGLFGPETPERYAPFNKKSISIYKGEDFNCSPCIKRYIGQDSKCKNPICLEEISIQEFKEKIKSLEKKFLK